MSTRLGRRGAWVDRAISDVYSYGGPLHHGSDITTRRRRMALLLRAASRGAWRPKLGLVRARLRGPAFVAERRRHIRDRVVALVRREYGVDLRSSPCSACGDAYTGAPKGLCPRCVALIERKAVGS